MIAGSILVFIPAMGMFVVPDLMGGAKTILVGNLIRNQFLTARDWPFGAAASMLLLIADPDLYADLHPPGRLWRGAAGMSEKKPSLGCASMRFWHYFYIYFPILILIIFSFNTQKMNVRWEGFTLHWYKVLFQRSARAPGNS